MTWWLESWPGSKSSVHSTYNIGIPKGRLDLGEEHRLLYVTDIYAAGVAERS